MPFQRNKKYLRDRTVESLGLLYAMHCRSAGRERPRCAQVGAARPAPGARRLALAKWRASSGRTGTPGRVPAEYEYSYGRQNWFAYSAQSITRYVTGGSVEQSRSRNSSWQGRDATRVLNRICTANIDVPVGRSFTPNGSMSAAASRRLDRHAHGRRPYLIVSACATQVRDLTWLQRYPG